MSERITKKWTPTLTEAFGDTEQIQKAIKAELIWKAYAEKVYDEVIYYSTDRKQQTAGVDFSIKKDSWRNYYTVDIKSNMKYGYFFVENNKEGWLRNPNKTTHRIVHIDTSTGWCCEYDREKMISYLDVNNYKDDLVRLTNTKHALDGFGRSYKISIDQL